MTTMDSDSESQDSDEGRRFRFEATRKDSNSSVNSRNKKSSPLSRRQSARRSRSYDRTKNRQRRDVSRSRQEHRRKRESGVRENSRYSRDFEKNLENRDASFRGTGQKSSRRESRNNDEKLKKYSRERTSQDGKTFVEKFEKSRRSKRSHSRDHSRERNLPKSRTKIADFSRSSNETTRDSASAKKSRRNDESRDVVEKNLEKNVDISLSNDTRTPQNCKDLNLSDFDIVSDTEDISSNNSLSGSDISVGPDGRENHRLNVNDDETRKRRVSRQHYERILKRHAVKKRRNLEEFICKKIKKTDEDDEIFSKLLRDETTKASIVASSSVDTKLEDMPIVDDNARMKVTTDEEKNFDEKVRSELKDSMWGPALPPKSLYDKMASKPSRESPGASPVDEEKMMKILRIVGPHLPENTFDARNEDDESEKEDTFGPALPPHLTARSDLDGNGHDIIFNDDNATRDEDITAESEDQDIMGPLPIDHPALENDAVQRQLEIRARRLKAELAACDNEDEKKREEWMIELPPAKSANLGLGARKFRSRPAPDMSDRSSWTDTPIDRARKRMEKLENKNSGESTVSGEGEARSESIEMEKTRKREKSLLEIHQKKLHKKKKKEEREAKKIGKKVERRPFDRDVDLQANRFDEARKKNVLLKARELDDRFSRGKI